MSGQQSYGLHRDCRLVNIIDVSTYGGIGAPGPESPAFTGHDNWGPAIGVTGMRTVMTTYVKQFHLQYSNIHTFVSPSGLTYWHLTTFPTLLFLNPAGQVIKRINGALTTVQVRSLIRHLERS